MLFGSKYGLKKEINIANKYRSILKIYSMVQLYNLDLLLIKDYLRLLVYLFLPISTTSTNPPHSANILSTISCVLLIG